MSDSENTSGIDRRDLLRKEAERMETEAEVERTYVRPAPAQDPSQGYSIRIPVERIEQLRMLAAANKLPPTTMLRKWLLERLEQERPAGSGVTGAKPKKSVMHLAKIAGPEDVRRRVSEGVRWPRAA